MEVPKHKSNIGMSNSDLASSIGNLKYDSTIELFHELSNKFKIDSDADRNRGRLKLSHHLLNISIKFKEMENEMIDIWKICEPFMKDDL